MRIYDCFTFFNELDMLEIRFNELDSVVDVFVIAESTATFQGQPKPLFFHENRHRFTHFLPKIRHIVFDGLYDAPVAWHREFSQRNQLRQGFMDAGKHDRIIISDVDEIPSSKALGNLNRSDFSFLIMRNFYFYLNWVSDVPWVLPYIASPLFLKDSVPDLSGPRLRHASYLLEENLDPNNGLIPDAGWHFSWMGGVEKILAKMAAFSHTEPEAQQWASREKVLAAIANRSFFSQHELTTAQIDSLPRHVRANVEEFVGKGLLRM